MKILRIINTLNPESGGPVESLKQSSKAHAENGHTTEVICLDHSDKDFLFSEGYSHLKINPLGPRKSGWGFSSKLIPWLEQNLNRFDAVIIHGLWLYPSFGAWKVLRKRSIPWYVFPHGMLDPWFQSWARRPFKSFRNLIYWHLIERKVIRDATAVLFTCKRESELAKTTFYGYIAREEIIPYGTSLPPPYREEMKEAFVQSCPSLEKCSYLLFLSRIHPKKGIDLLIMAYGEILKTNLTNQKIPPLLIAGPTGDDDYLKRIQDLSGKINNEFGEEKIIFCGMLKGDAKWGAFYGCEAFILPSHQENFGIVVAEALSCGKPVLISEQVNIWKEIEDAKAGFVAEDTVLGTVDLLQRWIELSVSNRESMGSHAIDCFRDKFDVNRSASEIIKLIEMGINK